MITKDERFVAAEIALLRKAVAGHPDDVDLRFDLAEALIESGQVAEGAALFDAAYRAKPSLRPVSLTASEPEARNIAGSTDRIATALIEAGVTYSAVLVAKAWAAAILGRADAVRRLIDPAFCREHVGMARLSEPASLERLTAEMIAGMTSHRLPWSAIRRASRNSHVFDGPEGRQLASHLRTAVDTYADALPRAEHPFVRARPDDYALRGWCVTFDGASRHISHIHPRAWISGVLYLRADAVSRSDHRGWLRIGPPDGISPQSGWAERWVRPEPGKLVLMPSYFTHETIAAGNDAARICIAFDVVPRELDFAN